MLEECGTACQKSGVPLSLALLPRLEQLLAPLREGTGERCLSDWNAGNLYLFRQAHDYRFHDGRLPYLSGRTYDATAHVFPLFDLSRTSLSQVSELAAGGRCFYPLSEAQKAVLDRDRFVCAASQDDADYLYPAENFRFYRGTVLGKKRNLMKQLLAAHAVHAEPFTSTHCDAAMQVLHTWMQDRNKGETEADYAACVRALEYAVPLGLEGFVFRADDHPAGFLLAQELQPGVFVIRFAKGIDRFKGIAQYMFHYFCVAFHRPVQWVNFEQDMGLENFRRTKSSYQPAALLAKYRVWLR